jgi:hypothetical protein
MRFIKRDQNGDLSLTEYLSAKDIPSPYAILSHRWGPAEQEVTMNEMLTGIGREKPGFKKIEACGYEASKDNIEYFWVDTCCIDKSSSAELSEAINSMFKWYRDAGICYAFLDDVGVCEELSTEDLAAMIVQSRWFSRGWTLQELIAPKEVRFFCKSWNPMGYRSALCQDISRQSLIEEDALRNGASVLQDISAAKRMSWAATRETTRPEDLSYCLLGIFDIQLPLLYGEGETKAFHRLQEAILNSCMDHSLLTWTPVGRIENLSGALASHPKEFGHTNSVESAIHYRDTDSITERGLRLQVPLVSDTNGIRAVLQCHQQDDIRGPLTLPLKAISEGVYARDITRRVAMVDFNSIKRAQYRPNAIPQIIFIPKYPPKLRGYNLSLFKLEMDDDSVILFDTAPKKYWIPYLQTFNFRNTDFNEKHCMAYFRTLSPNTKFIIKFGIRPTGVRDEIETFLAIRHLSHGERLGMAHKSEEIMKQQTLEATLEYLYAKEHVFPGSEYRVNTVKTANPLNEIRRLRLTVTIKRVRVNLVSTIVMDKAVANIQVSQLDIMD